MGLGTGHMTISTNTYVIPAIWAKEMQVAAKSRLVTANRVKRYDRDVSIGNTLYIPKFNQPTAAAHTGGTEVTFSSVTNAQVTLSINKLYEIGYLIDDALSTQSKYDMAKECSQGCGYGLAKQVDTDLNTLAASFSQQVGNGNTNVVSDEDIIAGIVYLDNADAPQEDRSLIVNPAVLGSMRNIDKFMSADFMNKGGVADGAVRQIYGIPVFVTTNVYASGTTRYNMLIQRECLALGMQKDVKISFGRAPTFFGDFIGGMVIYGVVENRGTFGCALLS